jgi:hypothetical protein
VLQARYEEISVGISDGGESIAILSRVGAWQGLHVLPHLLVRTSVLLLLVLLLASVACAAVEVREIPASPTLGFHWPYLLVVPAQPVRPTFLVVESNNSSMGSDDQAFHLEMAHKAIVRSTFHPGFQQLGLPYLMPVFPRPRAQ